MAGAATASAAFAKTVVGRWHFKDLRNSRQRGKVIDPRDEVLLLYLLAVLAVAECFPEIALFGTMTLALLRRFRPFMDGTRAHDDVGDSLAGLDADAARSGFVAWLPAGVVAIDGRNRRRSGHQPGTKAAIHMVPALGAGRRFVLGQHGQMRSMVEGTGPCPADFSHLRTFPCCQGDDPVAHVILGVWIRWAACECRLNSLKSSGFDANNTGSIAVRACPTDACAPFAVRVFADEISRFTKSKARCGGRVYHE